MASTYRFIVQIGGFEGAPGISVLHTTTGVSDDLGDMGNFMNQIANGYATITEYLIQGLTINVSPEVLKLSVETGQQQGVFNLTPPAQVSGIDASTQTSRATMAVCRHNTDGLSDLGHRVPGRTFIGPIGGSALDASGHINATARTAFDGMWDGMQDVSGTCRLIVWHRPRDPGTYHVEDPGTIGSLHHVQSTTTLIKPGVLRSRRD